MLQREVFKKAAYLFVITTIFGFGYYSVMYTSPIVRSWDEVDFVWALKRFDLLAMQPHFPGYPYFILGATLVHSWVADPGKALAGFNLVLAVSSVIPITLLARRYVGTAMGLLLAGLLLTVPYLWLMAARPMSECAGIAVLWWFLWSVRAAIVDLKSPLKHGFVLFLFSLLMGIRMSFFPFGLALLLLWRETYRISYKSDKRGSRRRLLLSLAAAGCFQLIWVGGLAMSEGSLAGFWKLSMAFVAGHFSEWGGGVVATPMPFGQRIMQLFGDNLIWQALLSGSLLNGLIYAVLIAATALGLWRLKRSGKLIVRDIASVDSNYLLWLAACIGLYASWALFGQNIEKPRHIAPIVGPCLFIGYVVAVRSASSLRGQRQHSRSVSVYSLYPLLTHCLFFLLVCSQFVHGSQLLQKQAEEIPAVYQLHHYLSSVDEPFVVYTWEETRVLQYLGAAYEHKRMYTYAYFIATAAINPGQRIFLTNHVVEGFERQDSHIRDHLKLVTQFSSDRLFDPVYHDITLYEYILKGG